MSDLSKRIAKLLGGDLYMHGWEDSWMRRHAAGSRASPAKITAMQYRPPLLTWCVEDHRGGKLIFSLRAPNNRDRVLAAYRGALGPEDFPDVFEREEVGDWWRVRRGAHLP